jgi:hypothetical protein
MEQEILVDAERRAGGSSSAQALALLARAAIGFSSSTSLSPRRAAALQCWRGCRAASHMGGVAAGGQGLLGRADRPCARQQARQCFGSTSAGRPPIPRTSGIPEHLA